MGEECEGHAFLSNLYWSLVRGVVAHHSSGLAAMYVCLSNCFKCAGHHYQVQHITSIIVLLANGTTNGGVNNDG